MSIERLSAWICGLAVALPATAADRPARRDDPLTGLGRVLKQFDFDERPLGNFEEIPMHWERHAAEGFPEYASGRFDLEIGRQAPPSFYLGLNGRSCAYHYLGLDIPVSGGTSYRVVGHVLPHGLRGARAYLSAYYRDASGMRIPGTERFSRLVGGTGAEGWEEISVLLPGNVPRAFSIGLSVWVTQSSVWWTGPRPFKHIEWKDVDGGAWFDDILVFRLPSLSLTSSAAARGHLFAPGEIPELQLSLEEDGGSGLQALLEVRDAAGALVHHQNCAAGTTAPHTQRIRLPNLRPGLYRARVVTHIAGGGVIERTLAFALLADLDRPAASRRRRYGLNLAPEPQPDWDVRAALLDQTGVRYGKIAIMPGIGQGSAEDPRQAEFIKRQSDAGVLLTGVLAAAPPAESAETAASLIDLLSLEPASWQPELAGLVTLYDNLLREWQVGLDGAAEVIEDARLPAVLQGLRTEMSRLTATPVLAAPWIAHKPLAPGSLPCDLLSVTLPDYLAPEDIPAAFSTFQGLEQHEPSAVVHTLPAPRYHRLARLVDFAKRLIYAHQSSARRIYVNQPWGTREQTGQPVTEIDEAFLILRTLVAYLDGAEYMGPLQLGGTATCHAYKDQGHCILVAWDDLAPPGGNHYRLFLNGAGQVTDLWGNRSALPASGPEHDITLTQTPVLIHDAESWLVEFRQGLRFEPALLPSESMSQELGVRLYNPRSEPISGIIKFDLPKGWQIRPGQVHFALQPRETRSHPVRLQAAPREAAGRKYIGAEVTLDAHVLQEFNVQLALDLDLADMEVWADLTLDGEKLTVRHGITNRSGEVVTFRSFADAPGRKRHNLNIVGLAPNQTVIKGHVFSGASELSGKVIRLGLRQIGGPRIHHLTVAVP